MSRIDRKTWMRLRDEFDTLRLLHAVDALDTIRSLVADRDEIRPPAVRDELLKLHRLAHTLLNEDDEFGDDADLWDLAFAIEDDIYPILENVETILETLRDLIALAPDPDEADAGEGE
jgi:hypothetical protein